MSPANQKNNDISELGAYFKDNSIHLSTEELSKSVDLEEKTDECHKHQALQKNLNAAPYKIEQDSVDVLREVRKARTQPKKQETPCK